MRPLYAILVSLFFAVNLSGQQNDFLWPGDVNNNGVVNEVDILYWAARYGTTGPARIPIDSNYIGFPFRNPWGTSFWNGIDHAYADCNGDGEVNDVDLSQVIDRNFNIRRGGVVTSDDFPITSVGNVAPLIVESETTQVNGNEQIEFSISLGNEEIQVDSFYGLSFRLYYDTTYIKTGLEILWDDQSWIRENDSANSVLYVKNRLDEGYTQIAVSRKDMQSVSGHGKILKGIIIVEDIIFKPNIDSITIAIDSVRMVGPQLQGFATAPEKLALKMITTNIGDPGDIINQLTVAPNPARNYLDFNLQGVSEHIKRIEIYNIIGQFTKNVTLPPETSSYRMNAINIEKGLYLIRTETDKKIYTHKIFIH